MVFAGDLQEVEEVGGGGVDGDGILVRRWGWVGEVDDLEIEWSLREKVGLGLNANGEGCGRELDTFTYS